MAKWWTEQKINAALTRQHVEKQLIPTEIQRLDQPVAFGADDLTERTYWESITTNAKRMFLILVDIGTPDQIFGIIDDAWDDVELPLEIEEVARLQLTASKDDRIDRKFHQLQFQYLIKTIDHGKHVIYDILDCVPIESVDGPTSSLTKPKTNPVDKVKLPNVPNMTFNRRRFSIGNDSGSISQDKFMDIVAVLKPIQNDHIISYWGSYTHQSYGYIIFTPISNFTLKSFLSKEPSSYRVLPKKQQREIVMNWILCLVDTVCFLHSRNRAHCHIKPSSIQFTKENTILLIDPTRLSSDKSSGQMDKASFDREWYDYAAPEQWYQPAGPGVPPSRNETVTLLSEASEEDLESSGRHGSESSGAASLTPIPYQQADIFSLGCIILELLSFLLKRAGGKFASFRTDKKRGGRPCAPLDTSFHKNINALTAWNLQLAKDAMSKASEKKASDEDGSNVFKGVTPILHVVTEMLSEASWDRLPAFVVQQRIYQIIRDNCGISNLHCVHQYAPLPHQVGQMLNSNPPGHSPISSIQTESYLSIDGFESSDTPSLLQWHANSSNDPYPQGHRSRRSVDSNMTTESDGPL